MKEIDDGGYAFPGGGMSMRDWFAGQALIGMLSMPGEYGDHARGNPDKAAAWSYQQADAMLAARKGAR